MATASARPLLLLGLALLAGCPAERLGVPVPPRGERAINQEDVQRDLHRLLQPELFEGVENAPSWVAQRLGTMRLTPAFGRAWSPASEPELVCGLLKGDDDRAGIVAIFSSPGPAGAELAALPDAALISLAKSADGLGAPRRTMLFCRAPAPSQAALASSPPLPWERVEEVHLLGPLGGPELRAESDAFGPLEATLHSTGPSPIQGSPQDGMERLDHRMIEGHLRSLHRQLIAPDLTAPGG
jgi:hypothetical protein